MVEARADGSRRRSRGVSAAVAAGGVMVVVVVAMLVGVSRAGDPSDASGLPTCEEVGPISTGEVAGYSGEQLAYAATIMAAGSSLGFDLQGQRLGVMAAMGESGLRNLDYGDWETSGATNPDGTPTSSIGLFQQQDWWGSVEERMDPAHAASLFFRRLAEVPGWQSMQPSHAIHRVQVNSDPDHYRRWERASGEVAVALACG